MNYKGFKRAKAIEDEYKKQFLKANPSLPDCSGIYFLTREDENGFKYAYIGQAGTSIIGRLAQHMTGYQHIDLSLRSHKLYDEEKNPYGWKVNFKKYPKSKLDEMEQHYIKQYALNGYQLRNKTSGSQGKGKSKIDEYKPSKGYHDGLQQGYKNASKEISHLFDLHLNVSTKKNPPTVNQQKALEKFQDFLNFHKGRSEDDAGS